MAAPLRIVRSREQRGAAALEFGLIAGLLFIPMPKNGVVTRTVKTMIEDTTSSGTC